MLSQLWQEYQNWIGFSVVNDFCFINDIKNFFLIISSQEIKNVYPGQRFNPF